MTEHSRFWDGTSTGHASEAPYDFASELSEAFSAVMGIEGTTNKGGVLRGLTTFRGSATGKLTASGTGSPVAVSTGIGMVYGSWYWNDASINMTVPTPAGATRYDRIVLRKDWVLQTVILVRIQGAEGAGVPPALGAGTAKDTANVAIATNTTYTQTFGTCWDYTLYTLQITTGGVITLTDVRDFLPVHGDQTGESGNKHDWGNINGRPAFSGSVTNVAPGQAGAAGSAGTISDGGHTHAVPFEPWAHSTVTRNFAGTTLADHSDLQLSLEVGTYEFDAWLLYNTGSVGDGIKLDVTFGGTATLLVSYGIGQDPTTITSIVTKSMPASFGADGSSADNAVHVHGVVTVTVAGTLKVRCAAIVSAVGTLAGSSINAKKVA